MAKIIPDSPMSKRQIFDEISNFNPNFFPSLFLHDSEKEFLKEYGYDNLEDMLRYEYSYEGENLEKAKSLITKYYKIIKPGDVLYHTVKLKVVGYSNVELICSDYDADSCFIVATKF